MSEPDPDLLDPEAMDAHALDAADPLARFRRELVVDDDPVVYLDGNSLGRAPRRTLERLDRLYRQEWAVGLIRSWEHWVDLPEQVGDELGAAVLGAAAGQTVVADSTSVLLYKALHAAAALRPDRDELVVLGGDFPTDAHLATAVARARGLRLRTVAPRPPEPVTAADVAAVAGPRTACVLLSLVDYRSAALADLAAVTAAVHAAGAVVVWDLSHAAGAVPVHLDRDGADLAVGCTYKYLNAGPGAPAYLYAAARHHDRLVNPVPGWFGAADVFAMAPEHVPAPGVRRMLSGTPPVPGLVAVQEGVRLVAEAGVAAVRDKSVLLTRFAVARARRDLVPLGWRVASPPDGSRRGSHVVLAGPGAESLVRRATARGVVADFRHPDLVRLGLSPLSTSFAELSLGMDVLAELATTPA
ncbi:aminotransferase class V-fold PLP-dependent enzyme [Jannaschia sp. R86511]|uniref:aminotransferase class V-fold PLP-dependent enzyme n=1 Tax=Jannaschia sp. R86511 TaxID=3093853 RepID=UPI0036D3DD79